MKYIIIILLSVLIIYLYKQWQYIDKNSKTENYDGKIGKITTRYECGDICSRIYNCAGFAHDEKTGRCYVSKTPMLGRPINKLYDEDYKKEQYGCNKAYIIKNEYDIDDTRKIMNRIYTCYANNIENNNLELYDNNMIRTDFMPDDITNKNKLQIKPYDMKHINWPTKKIEIDLNNQDGLVKAKDEDKFYSYLIHDDEYLGKYMFPHMCVSNISLRDCLKSCSESKDCVGVEHNPSFIGEETYKNVCCPKSKIAEIVTRSDDHKSGKYYEKIEQRIDNFNKANVIIM